MTARTLRDTLAELDINGLDVMDETGEFRSSHELLTDLPEVMLAAPCRRDFVARGSFLTLRDESTWRFAVIGH